MDSKRTAIVVVLLLVAGAGTAGTANAANDYTITLDPAVDTPPRPAEIDSETFTVSAIGHVDPGEIVSAEVSGPEGGYDVVVYDAQEDPIAEQNASGDATLEFDTSGWDAGIYLVAVRTGGDVHAVQPLVVSAFDLEVTAPDEATEDSSVQVAVELEPNGEAERISVVGAIVADDDRDTGAPLEAVGEGALEYEGAVNLTELQTGEYSLYVVVQGEATGNSDGQILAFSEPQPLTIASGEEDEENDQNDGDEVEDEEAGNDDVSFDYNHREGLTTDGNEDEPEETETPTETETETPEPTTTAAPTTTEREAGNADDVQVTQESRDEADGPVDEPAGLTSGMIIPAVILAALLLLVLVFRFR